MNAATIFDLDLTPADIQALANGDAVAAFFARLGYDTIKSVTEQQALEVAPRTIDPIQQTVATAIQGYLNHPDVDRREAIDLIRFLNQPMLSIQIRELRAALRSFKAIGQANDLIEAVRRLKESWPSPMRRHTLAHRARLCVARTCG